MKTRQCPPDAPDDVAKDYRTDKLCHDGVQPFYIVRRGHIAVANGGHGGDGPVEGSDIAVIQVAFLEA